MTSSTAPSSPVVGMSVGATTLAAVTATRALTGRPVLGLAGGPIADFVDRVGDPVGILAADGSLICAADLLAGALLELARAAAPGQPVPARVAVAHPGHWRPAAVEALRRALRRVPSWSGSSEAVTLVPDYAAALTAVRADPGLSDRGVVAVCDIGGSGTTVTLVDLGEGLPRVGEPEREADFSGGLVDRVLLGHVLAAAGTPPGGTGTSEIGALARLRTECRAAKERLSACTATVVPGGPTGLRGDVRITRAELEDLIREPLGRVVAGVQEGLQRNGIAAADLAAVILVGGGASIPLVATTLSEKLRAPVIAARRPGLAAAEGAALRVAGGTSVDDPTVLTPRPVPRPADVVAGLAWSRATHIPEVVPQALVGRRDPRPMLDFAADDDRSGVPALRWYQRPLLVAAAVLMVVAGAGGAAALALRTDSNAAPPGVASSGDGPVPEAAGASGPEPAGPVLEEPGHVDPVPVGQEPGATGPVNAAAPPRRTVIATPAPVPPVSEVAEVAPTAASPAGETPDAAPPAPAAPPPFSEPVSIPLPAIPDMAIPNLPIPLPVIPDLAAITPIESIPVLPQLLPAVAGPKLTQP